MVKPTRNNVLIKKEEESDTTSYGIVLTSKQEKDIITGVVEATGPEVSEIKAGDKIIFNRFIADEISEGGEFYLVGENEILAVIE